ncbi:4Fe-4S binding protein [Thermodesulfobacteriota bacterium]
MAVEKSDKKNQRRNRAIRLIIVLFVLILSTVVGLLHQYPVGFRPVSVDAFCPFGGIESAFTLITTGVMIKRIAWSSFILLFATLIVAILFRRSFCGNICPLGTLQELFGKLGKLVFKKRLEVPCFIDIPGRYLKYIVLIVFVVISSWLGSLVIRPYDPWAAYHHLASADLFKEFSIGFIVLIASLLGSMLYDRFFCKYLCPMGGFLGLINRLGWFRVRRNDDTCTHCKACDKACPVNIRVEDMKDVQSSECINCNLCVEACPVKDTLVIEGPKKVRINSSAMFLITVTIFIAVLGFSTTTGSFQWTMKQLGETVTESSGFDPGLIKGRDTFQDVSKVSGITKELFLKRFKISEEDFSMPIKNSAHREGSTFDMEDVRQFVKEHQGR